MFITSGYTGARTIAVILAVVLITSGFKACSQSEKDRNIALAKDIAGAFRAAAPIVARKNPGLADKMRSAADSGDRLVDAFRASNETEIPAIIRDILPVFNEVVASFSDNENVLIALALAQIALNFFVNRFLADSVARAGRRVGRVPQQDSEIIETFKALPQFGCKYKPERCKD